MKDTLQKIIIGGAVLIGSATAPIIPSEMELLYSFQCPCLPEVASENATTTPQLDVSPEYVSAGNESVSVFADKKGNKIFVQIPTDQYDRMGRVAGIAENPQKTEFRSVFESFVQPEKVEAAVAYDSGIYAQSVTATSLTFSFTNTAGNVIYVFGHDRSNGTSQVTGVTYAGSALTKIVELDGASTRNDRALTSWRRTAPATGANNVVVTSSVSNNLRFSAVSYSGVDATTPENGTDTSFGQSITTLSTDITPTFTGCWHAHFSKDSSGGITYTNTTGDTVRLNTDAGGHVYVDTNGTITASVQNTVTNTMTSTAIGALAWTVCPTQSVERRIIRTTPQ